MALNHNNHQQQQKTATSRTNKKRRSSTTIDNDSKMQLKQQSITEVFSAKQQWDGNSKQAESANRAVATFIACESQAMKVATVFSRPAKRPGRLNISLT